MDTSHEVERGQQADEVGALMRGILIDPKARSITEIDCDDFGDPEIMNEVIQCRKFEMISRVVGLATRDALFVDEEAKIFRPDDPTFRIKGVVSNLIGNGLIVGHTIDGDSTSARTSLKALRRLVFF